MMVSKDIETYGKHLEKLGKALQDPESTMRQLADLARDCGMSVHVFIGNDNEETPKQAKTKPEDKTKEGREPVQSKEELSGD